MPQQGSGFTFAAGNARKLLALPGYAVGAMATRLVRRRPDLWVFGSGSGIGEGALPLYRMAERQERVWLTSSPAEAEQAAALGITSVPKGSWRGFRLTLRAGVIVVTHGFGDVNRFATRGAFVIQLWHGIPLKHIQLDAAVTFGRSLLGRVLRRAYRRSAANIDLVPAASELSAIRLRTAFGLPVDRVVVTGDPRDDVMVTVPPLEARARLEELLGTLPPTVLLYAPTWRDGELDPAIPSAAEWDAIDAWLHTHDAALVVRPHPHGVGAYLTSSERVRMLPASLERDITPLLPGFDILVTDYSSIAFDFALTGNPIAFLAPDVTRYSLTRGLYEPYVSFSGGTDVATWAELLDVLERPDELRAHSARLAETHHAFRDGQNTARVYDEAGSRLGSTEGPRMTTSLSIGTAAPIDSVVVSAGTAPAVTFSGPVDGAPPATVALSGARLSLEAPVKVVGQRWSAAVSLLASRWGGPLLPAPSGRYEVLLDSSIVAVDASDTLVPGVARVTIAGTSVSLSAPLSDAERGAANQARLEAEYRSRAVSSEPAVFFESFYGQNASCNPRAIDAAVARLLPETKRYWSVVDASVAVPEGAIPIIEGSADWWRVRAEAPLLVVNDWLRKRYKKHTGQTVLQTWHGTMLKKIATDRPKHGLRATIATVLESRRWDVLLSQNPHSTKTLRSAYKFAGPIWEEGYPRDDVLATPDGAATRARLGIAAETIVLLYAPTWRDDRLEHIDHLDVAAFTDSLEPGYVTLIRGHSRTLRPGRDVKASNVIDVTGYPDVSDLFLAADALITDYSSVMFDFSVTGKPIFFYTPDLDHYREQLRGFYFDLLEVAPGPVVQEAAELSSLVLSRDAVAAEYADRYAAWRSRFNPRDDGHAGERIVARLIERGAL